MLGTATGNTNHQEAPETWKDWKTQGNFFMWVSSFEREQVLSHSLILDFRPPELEDKPLLF